MLCIIVMMFVRLYKYLDERKTENIRKLLVRIITESIHTHKDIVLEEIPTKLKNYRDVLFTVENFDRYLVDPVWQKTKKKIIDGYLLPGALPHIESHSWQDRQMALRCYALDPKRLVEDSLVLPMLDDEHFLVRIVAALCLIRSVRREVVLPVIKQMVKESAAAQYPYRDLLIKGDGPIFEWLGDIVATEKDQVVVAACLDVLSTKIHKDLLPLAMKHITSPNEKCRLAALKIVSRIPGKETSYTLCKALQDPYWEVRAYAASSLGRHIDKSHIPPLVCALNDQEWFVRLKAAEALKHMGQEGRDELYKQSSANNPEAHEIAQYILSF